MKLLTFFLLFAAVLTGGIFSQSAVYSPFSINSSKTLIVANELRGSVDGLKVIDVDKNMLSRIVRERTGKIAIDLPSGSGVIRTQLTRFDILTPDAKIVAGTETGDRTIDMNNSFVVYTSDLHDRNTPMIVLTIFENDASAFVSTEHDVFILTRRDLNEVNSDHIFYQDSKIKGTRDMNCGTDGLDIPEKVMNLQSNLTGQVQDFSTSQLLKANIAVESDYETFLFYGGVQNAASYILRLLAPVSAIYIRDINIQIQSSYLRVWETSADPYNGTTSSVLLNEFRAYWNANMSSVPRTIAHYITTRPGGLGGIAWVNVLCSNLNNGFGYAFSDIDGTFNNLPAYSWDVMVVSHETGHNFGSPHTHNCGWPGGPIDSCYATEGGCYSGPPISRVGTVMSYCHLNGSISLTNGFGQLPSELIRLYAESAPCLNNVTGFLVATPNGGEIFRSNQNALAIWGTDFTGNVNVEYSVNNGSNWVTIQNNVPATNRFINFSVPYIPTTTQARLRVYESGNSANGDQSDSVFQIRPVFNTFSVYDPPQLHRTYVSSGDTSQINFKFTSTGTLPEIRYKWYLSTLNNAFIYNKFSDNSGTDSTCGVSYHILDSLVSSWGASSVGDSLRVKWYVKAYTELDSQQTNNSFLITFVRSVIGIEPISTVIPGDFFVNPNYPNPFNPATKIKFGLPKSAFVKMSVYDILGREVAVLVNEQLQAGEFQADWNASNFPSGIYFYRIEADNFVKTAKMMLIK
jgi:hypothetical protein